MKIWAISDSHNKEKFLKVPEGIDMVIFGGDAGTHRDPSLNANGVIDFLEWFNSLYIKHKVFIPGNHDTSIQRGLVDPKKYPSITYLNHEATVIEGIKIFGSPYTPTFGTGWAYNVARHKLDQYWIDIPTDTDILITHGPPKGILDLTQYDSRAGADGKGFFQCGCKSLLNRIKVVEPKYHIFGHIHPESNCPNAATTKVRGIKTTFINACVVDLGYEVVNDGYVFEYGE